MLNELGIFSCTDLVRDRDVFDVASAQCGRARANSECFQEKPGKGMSQSARQGLYIEGKVREHGGRRRELLCKLHVIRQIVGKVSITRVIEDSRFKMASTVQRKQLHLLFTASLFCEIIHLCSFLCSTA